jgi:hypothetical protein
MLAARRTNEAVVLAAELGWTLVAHLMGSSCRRVVLVKHEQPGLVQLDPL